MLVTVFNILVLMLVFWILYREIHFAKLLLRRAYRQFKPKRAVTVYFLTDIGGLKKRITHMFLKVSQQLPLAVAFADAKGNPAKVDGKPQWALTDESLAAIEVADDGMSAILKPIGAIGAFKVQVKADGDMGEGVKEIMGELEIELLAADAVSVVISAGEPVEQA